MNKVLGVGQGVMFHSLLLDFFLHSLNAHVQPFQEGAVPEVLLPTENGLWYLLILKSVV
jgi:hypothetical protein